METILSSPLFKEMILPFLLVFTLIFAILDKLKILGEEKRQINAIIAFVVGLIFVSFSQAVEIGTNLIAVVAVIAVIILFFMILYGFAVGEKEFKMPKGLKITFGILIGLALIIALLVFTGYWQDVYSAVITGNNVVANIIFIVIIIAAVVIVLSSKKSSGS